MVESDEKTVLVFQGGGALGAYQAGAYESLHASGIQPDWLAGISIGAINSAIIAGSAPDDRVANLRSFWHTVSSGNLSGSFYGAGDSMRKWFNDCAAMLGTVAGVSGFFTPRALSPLASMGDPMARISLYDTSPLHGTLATLVDFDRINTGAVRLSLGAVDVENGNFRYFDNRSGPLDVRHVAASGALPPGFAPVDIDGRYYWDGGLVSNTPLQKVLAQELESDLLIFQLDLFSATGSLPQDLFDVEAREKEIRFSSRTRMNTDLFRRMQMVRGAAKRLTAKLPPDLADDPDARLLEKIGNDAAVTIVHLIYRQAAYEGHSKDYEFSRMSVEDHWNAGYRDVCETLESAEWKTRTRPENGIRILDLAERRLKAKSG